MDIGEFDAVFSSCEETLQKPMNPRLELPENTSGMSRVRAQVLSLRAQLFILFYVFTGSNEGSRGIAAVALAFQMSLGTASNTIYHALCAAFVSFKSYSFSCTVA